MKVADQRLSLSKRAQRRMTDFFTRELLYDYAVGSLDQERRKALEEQLATHHEATIDLEKIRWGLDYAQRLGKTQISAEISARIDEPETYLSILLKKTNFSQWPLTVKWAIEAAVVLTVFLVALIVIPWDQALKWGLSSHGRQVVLAEVDHGTNRMKDQIEEGEGSVEKPQFEDEDTGPVAKNIAARARSVPTVDAPPVKQVVIPQIEIPKPQTPEPVTPPSNLQKAAAVAEVAAKKGPEPESHPKVTEGFLYRGRLKVTNLPVIGPKIRDKILELGGRKAGEVDLGWQKTPTSVYFHFTIPDAKYEDLKAFLDEYGQAAMAKEKHSRVMPDGIIRLILTVEEDEK